MLATSRPSPTTSRFILMIGILGGGVFITSFFIWLSVTSHNIGRSDFTSTFVGATILVHHGFHQLYSPSLQSLVHAHLIAPDKEGNLPFVNPPFAAILAAPFTALPLDTAYRLFVFIQLLCIVAGTVLVLTPRELPITRAQILSLLAMSCGTPAVLALMLLGQWDGVLVLSTAAGFLFFRKGHRSSGILIILIPMLAIKPHLALGIGIAFLATGTWDMIAPTVASGMIIGISTLLLLGVHGTAQYLTLLSHDATMWPYASFEGLSGLFGSWFGNTMPTAILTAIGTVLCMAGAIYLGRRMHRHVHPTTADLSGVVIISLLMCPHLLMHDLVLLIPPMCALVAQELTAPEQGIVDVEVGIPVLLGFWCAGIIAEGLDFGHLAPYVPGKLVPLLLALSAVLLLVGFRLRPTRIATTV